MTNSPFGARLSSYGGVAIRGAMATGASQIWIVLCQLVSVIVLSRLLSPADFGIVAMSGTAIALVGLFQSFGLTQATIQREKIGHPELNFLFWTNTALTVSIALLVLATAPAVAWFYGRTEVEGLLTAMCLVIVIQGLGSQHSALITRGMRFNTLALVEVGAALAGLAVSVLWALNQPTYWALFGGALAMALTQTVAYWFLSGWRPGWPALCPDAASMLKFGAGLTGFN
ncbi:MAG: oligosaccharide flippase family protein, partial [Pseudomonadota bacterium]